jgi:RNA polymerase sigma-70 factor (ECF subfamily)
MDNVQAATVTQMLGRWSSGDRDSFNQVLPIIQQELHRIAQRHMRKERSGHTLQTTALVNEAYLKLVDQAHVSWQSRAHFFGIAARIMRQILVDHARGVRRAKRGGDLNLLPFEEALNFSTSKAASLVALDDALLDLARKDARKVEVVELRYFGGLSVEETAEVLNVHPNTVIRDWALAKAWLRKELDGKA